MSKTLGILNYDYTINITRTAKTNYEQQQEQHRESLYMKLQKALGWILMVGSIVGIWYEFHH
jgi:nucleosome binding factor SPN SPT16 subunit